MKLRERKWATCPACDCRTKLLEEEQFGCDNCETPTGEDVLELTVFRHNGETASLHFCSWACVAQKLKETETDYFVSLPMLSFETKTKGQTVQDFLALLK